MKVKYLGRQEYAPTLAAMQEFTENRTEETEDQLWVVEHPAVFTQGQRGKPEHILQASDIPIVQVDRGGQVTYHGPGQLVIYTLINFKRLNRGVRELVRSIENAIIATLNEYGIESSGDVEAPGVYTEGKKIAALGLRIRKGAVYHGLSLNVNMDLTPFSYINPCGYAGLEVAQIADYINPAPSLKEVAEKVIFHLNRELHLDARET